MNVKLIVIFAVVVNSALCGVVEKNRPKRTLHYFFEGLLSALSEKHRSASLSEENTDFLPFGLSKHKFMGLSGNAKSAAKPLVQVPIPSDKPKPNTGSLRSTASGPTKVVLPLDNKPIMTTSKPSTTTKDAAASKITSTATETSTTTTTTAKALTASTSTSTSTSTSSTSAPESTTSESSSSEATTTDDEQEQPSSTVTAETTLTTSTTNTDSADDTSNATTAVDTTTLSNEIQSKADMNISSTNIIGVEKVPLLPVRAPLLNNGRHTQFFGNPLIIQRHNSYLPSYYHEDDYENGIEQNVNTNVPYRAAKYLPPAPNHQVIVLPMAVPFQLPTAGPAASIIDERSPRQSRTKMHDSDYNHYINHGTGQLQVPVVHLHQAHIQYFGHQPQRA